MFFFFVMLVSILSCAEEFCSLFLLVKIIFYSVLQLCCHGNSILALVVNDLWIKRGRGIRKWANTQSNCWNGTWIRMDVLLVVQIYMWTLMKYPNWINIFIIYWWQVTMSPNCTFVLLLFFNGKKCWQIK